MKTKFGTNQAAWSWELFNGDENYPRKIIYCGINWDSEYIYDDMDRTIDLASCAYDLSDFIKYSAGKFNMTTNDKKWLELLIYSFNWNDIRCSIDLIDNDVPKEFHEFLIKYNFKIYLNEALTLS